MKWSLIAIAIYCSLIYAMELPKWDSPSKDEVIDEETSQKHLKKKRDCALLVSFSKPEMAALLHAMYNYKNVREHIFKKEESEQSPRLKFIKNLYTECTKDICVISLVPFYDHARTVLITQSTIKQKNDLKTWIEKHSQYIENIFKTDEEITTYCHTKEQNHASYQQALKMIALRKQKAKEITSLLLLNDD